MYFTSFLRVQIEEELKNICEEVIHIVEDILPRTAPPESRVFFHKMLGDYYRFALRDSPFVTHSACLHPRVFS